MAAIERQLFDWNTVEARSDLDRFFLVRNHLPDEQPGWWEGKSAPGRREVFDGRHH